MKDAEKQEENKQKTKRLLKIKKNEEKIKASLVMMTSTEEARF